MRGDEMENLISVLSYLWKMKMSKILLLIYNKTTFTFLYLSQNTLIKATSSKFGLINRCSKMINILAN